MSELEEQGLIQAFAFTHELSWLLLRDFLMDQGVSGISGSRDAVREAVARELLTDIASLIQVSYAEQFRSLAQAMTERSLRR